MDNREYTLGVEAYVEEEIPNIEEEFLKAPWLSRRFWIFLLVPVVAIGIAFYPPLAEVREQLIGSLAYLAVSLIGGLSVTHAAGRVEPAWKSRRFWVAVGSTALDIAVSLYPPVASIRTELIDLIAWAGMAIIGGFTLTDLALLKGWTKKL
jgi:hypothetical protein